MREYVGGAHPLDPLPETQSLPQAVWEKLPGWRDKWAELWYVFLEERFWVFRSPTRGDAINHDLNAISAPALAQESFVKKCLLFPEDELPKSLEAFFQLYNVIWTASGFRDPLAFHEKLAEFEELVYQPDQAYVATILTAFDNVSIDKINSWQPDKIIHVLALARMKLGLPPVASQKPRRNPRDVQINDQAPPAEGAPPETPAPRAPRPAAKRGAFDWESERAEWDAFNR